MTDSALFEAKVEVRRRFVRLMASEFDLVAAAIEVDEYDIAKELFDSARKIWFRFGGTIKRQSEAAYEAVHTSMAESSSSFDAQPTDKAALLANLRALTKAANAAVVVSDANL